MDIRELKAYLGIVEQLENLVTQVSPVTQVYQDILESSEKVVTQVLSANLDIVVSQDILVFLVTRACHHTRDILESQVPQDIQVFLEYLVILDYKGKVVTRVSLDSQAFLDTVEYLE